VQRRDVRRRQPRQRQLRVGLVIAPAQIPSGHVVDPPGQFLGLMLPQRDSARMLDLRLDSPWMGHGGLACGTGLRASKPCDRCFSAGQTPDALNEGEQRTPAAYRTLARGGNYFVLARRIERLIEHLVSQDTVDREKRT